MGMRDWFSDSVDQRLENLRTGQLNAIDREADNARREFAVGLREAKLREEVEFNQKIALKTAELSRLDYQAESKSKQLAFIQENITTLEKRSAYIVDTLERAHKEVLKEKDARIASLETMVKFLASKLPEVKVDTSSTVNVNPR